MDVRTESGSISPWMDRTPAPLRPLMEDVSADVAIVGAGIAGLSVAYELARRGRGVVIVDDGPIGGGETGRTTAHLVTALDRRYYSIERMHGAERAALAAESHAAAVDRIEEIVQTERIHCDFQRLSGYLYVPESLRSKEAELIERERSAALRAGVACAVREHTPSISCEPGPCLEFLRQGQFHPLSYLEGLAEAITRRGGRIFTGTHAEQIEGGKNARVVCAGGRTVVARAVVVATNTPVNDRIALHTKQIGHRTYVLGMGMPTDTMPPALFWDGFWDDPDDPYHYVRLATHRISGRTLLIVGGEDHKTGRADDGRTRYDLLESWARVRFPMATSVEFRWSGQVIEPLDELAFIGRNPGHEENVFVVTGDSGNGMTHALIAGMMLPDLIDGQDHRWKALYSPSRLPIGAPGTAVMETAEMVSEYRDWLVPHDGRPVEELGAGEGTVVRHRGKLLAVFKRMDGSLRWHSAVCPHLLGVVRWNAAEHSWDCPCHGSRFDCDGRVINGPANRDLAPAAEPTEDRAAVISGAARDESTSDRDHTGVTPGAASMEGKL